MKKTLLLTLALVATTLAFAAKIYVNPGHGTWGANDRNMATITHALGDTTGFYESNTNMWKCYYLREKLQKAGHTVVMSHTACGYSPALSTVATEAQRSGADYFISVHSNAHSEGSTTNYPAYFYRGKTGNDYSPGSINRIKKAWPYCFDIHNQGMEHHSNYSLTNVGLYADITFQGGSSSTTTIDGVSYTGYYGVLRHGIPGYLIEGYFHTYQPARHRALSPEWCRQEGLRHYRGIAAWYGNAPETKGYIMGYIRTKDKQINQTNYTGRAGNDIYMPINGAKVYLTNAAGDTIMTNCYNYVARMLKNQKCYTTDNNYNGVFAYEDLTPGTYTITVRANGYKKYTQNITVTADKTSYTQIFLTTGTDTEEDDNTEPDPTPTPGSGTTIDPGYDGTEATNATGLNPYAYGLTSELSADSTQVTLRWWLNAPATTVKIIFNDGEKDYVVRDYTNVAVDGYKDVIQTSALPRGKKLTWRVDVTGAGFKNATEYATNYSLYHPSSVDIDNNPENPTFGTLITNEAMQAVKSLTGYISSGYGAGIYVFDPTFKPVKNGSNPGFNGGITFTNNRADAATTAYSPRRVRISDDGRIFVTGQNTDGKVLWEVNPNDYNQWTEVIAGKVSTADVNDVLNGSGTYIGGPNVSLDVRGSGKNLQLVMLSGIGKFKCSEYNLGTATSWNAAPSKTYSTTGIVNYTGTNVQYDKDGGIWYCQYRGAASASEPSLVHINANGTKDYTETVSYRRNGAFRFNNDFTKVAIAGIAAGTNSKSVTIYSVSQNASGAPVLTQEYVINMTTIGNNINDLAWDYAGNLYACGNSSEKIAVWALPHSNGRVISTPAATKYAFTLQAEAVEPEPEPEPEVTAKGLNPFAYALSSSLSTDNTLLTVNYTLNATATEVNILVLNGETVVKTIPCTGITKGTYAVEIPTAELPKETALTWQVDVKGAAVTQATFVDNSVKLYSPTSIDIDNNPQNENFGTVFVVEGKPDAKDNATYANYLSYTDGAGLYLLNADGSARPMPNRPAGKYGYNGGRVQQARQYFNGTASGGYSPYRVRVSDDGRIFITSMTPDGQILWEADPLVFSRPNAADWEERAVKGWASVMSSKNENTVMGTAKRNCTHTYCGIYNLYEGNAETGTFIAGPNIGFDVQGSGKDLKLIMLAGCKEAIVNFTPKHFYCDEYDLGTATMWNTAPSRRVFAGNVVNYTGTQVQYDKDGNVWMCQHRSGTDAATLMKFNGDATDAVLYNEDPKKPYHRCGAIRFNNDYTQVAIATIGSGTGGAFTVYPVVDGMPVWNQGTEVDCKSVTHHSLMDFAWDYAGNLYIAADAASGNAGHCVAIYAMPHAADRVVSTPAADQYTFTLPKPVYTVTATANDPAMGMVEGAGTYAEGATATLTATPAAGHQFLNWTVGGETLTDNPLTLTVTSDITAVANFAVIEHTVTATANDPAMGTVEGAGTYAEGATATLTATPAAGHQFVNWTVGGETLADNPLTLTVTGDITAVANFAVIEHTVTATANDPAMGTVEGAGTYAEGATATLTATPAVGHQFLNWTVGGETLTENPLTLTVTGDITAVANFAVIEHTVTATANDPAMGTVEGAGTYAEGATATLTATPAAGHQFLNWTVGGETLADNPLTLTVTGDITAVANFAVIEHTVTVTANDPAMGTVEGAGTYAEGATATLTATPKEGYEFSYWVVAGDTLTDNPLTVEVNNDMLVEAIFAAIPVPTYMVTVIVNDSTMGIVEGTGEYEEGTVVTLTAVANTGFVFSHWTIDGEAITDNPMTITVDGDIVIGATFKTSVTTDVDNVENTLQVEKLIINDRVYIRINDQLYTLTGARVQ